MPGGGQAGKAIGDSWVFLNEEGGFSYLMVPGGGGEGLGGVGAGWA